jgi:hypothetical protein
MPSVYQTHKPAGGGDSLFLKLKDGESVKIRIASEPAVYTPEFDGNVSTRYAWVVFNRNEKKAQVFSQGVSVFRQLADLVEEWGEPTSFDLTIKRTGEMLETRYSVTPAPKSVDLTAEEQAECEKIDLLAAVKGSWLSDFEEGAPMSGYDKAKAQRAKLDGEPELTDEDAPLSDDDLANIPF